MTPRRRALLVAGVGGIAAAAGYAAHRWWLDAAPVAAGAAAAILGSRLQTLDGVPQTLERYRGQVLVINYWATWCAPCREEIPLFVRLQQEYGTRGLQFVGIAIDQPDPVRRFAAEYRINYPLLIGGIDAMELSRQAGNRAGVLPYTLVLDRGGNIASGLVGGITESRMRQQLEPLL